MPFKIFISYSHKDKALRDELANHLANLRNQQLISDWYDGDIIPGTEWEQQILDHLNNDQIILLLISADFMASHFCYSIEMQQAIVRHDKNQARVLPILLRPTDWEGSPFAKLQLLPSNGVPVTRWPSHDDAFENVVKGIRRAINDLQVSISTNPSSAYREQQTSPHITDVVEATKFIFDEVRKWLDDVRQHSTKSLPELTKVAGDDAAPKLTRQDFAALQANQPELEAAINLQLAKTDAYAIRGLVTQIQTHRRNLIDFETIEAQFGPLTPQYVKRGIEHEADEIVGKLPRLKSLLEQVYGRSIENA